MCGICGLVDHRPDHDVAGTTQAMNDAMDYRGPDDEGMLVDGVTAIAMRRLAIIDLVSGHQPMTSADGRHTIVFNGEIYNYRSLRDDLVARGHQFHTQSDTEVVLQLHQAFGERACERLNGMFGYCVLDHHDGSLFVARDQYGQKPLFYAHTPDRFVFSSEIPSLLADPTLSRRLDRRALAHYLRVQSVPAPLTMIEGIRQLPPSNWLRVQGAELVVRRYGWDGPGTGAPITDDDEAISAVSEALIDSVGRHLVADVPVGCFLSGGLDSAAVVAAATRATSDRVRTFTVRWEDAEFDESPVARRVSEHLGTDHQEITVARGGFDEKVFWEVIDHLGQPFVDTSVLPTFLLCREVRQHSTVALSGDGGDEMFGGYEDFGHYQRIASLARFVPRPLASIGRQGLDWAATRPMFSDRPGLRQARRAARVIEAPPDARTWATYQLTDEDAFAELVGDRLAPPDMDPVRAAMASWRQDTPLREMMAYRGGFVMADQMLPKVDRMSMASSLEVRAPMLDRRLGAVANRLSDAHLRRDGVGKWVLRRILDDWVPPMVLQQPKRGFGAPLHSLSNDRFVTMCREIILDPHNAVMNECFDPVELRRVVESGLAAAADGAEASRYRSSNLLWALLILAAWTERFGIEP